MNTLHKNMSLTGDASNYLNALQKIGTILGLGGLAIIFASLFVNFSHQAIWLSVSLLSITSGVLIYAKGLYQNKPEGIKNHGVWFKSISGRGLWGWVTGVVLTGFYIVLYFYEGLLGAGANGAENTGIVGFFDPLSKLLSGNPASQWFVYGTLYTIAIIAFGIKFMWKYKHNKYEQLRTLSVMFFQTGFAFLIPELMARLNSDTFSLPYNDLKNMWPLNYYAFDGWRVDQFINAQTIGLAFLIFAILLVFVISPILTYKYGKRWYCSWVCGCGGLAETAGDSFRQLSNKSMKAWKIERWVIHSVLVFSVVMTTAVIATYLGYDSEKYWLTKDIFLIAVAVFLGVLFGLIWYFKKEELKKDARYGAIGYLVIVIGLIAIHYFSDTANNKIFLFEASKLRSFYGFLIGAIFSGVIGTGFYPIFGSRVWCRMGCPMAGILGIQQRLFSKFRITTNGGQCISCGNCSTYCEMGIDVRSYAQKGENIIRASCVGCGICSAVCPRGVLKLENGPLEGRINSNEILLGNDVNLLQFLKK